MYLIDSIKRRRKKRNDMNGLTAHAYHRNAHTPNIVCLPTNYSTTKWTVTN